MNQQEFMYSGLGECLKKEWKIYLAALIFIIIADSIGQIKIPLGPGTLILFPIFYSIFLGILSGPQILKIFKKPEVKAASKLVIVCICPFIAKLGINAGASIETVISAGPALLLHEFGNLGTIFLSLPIALLLGLKREAVGACHSINRETNLAVMPAKTILKMATQNGAHILDEEKSVILKEGFFRQWENSRRPYGISDLPWNHNRSDLLSFRCRRPCSCNAPSGSLRCICKDRSRRGTF